MEFLNKAKDLLNVAGAKTEDFIYEQRCNLEIARVCSQLKKAYERLGRLSYKKLNNITVDDNVFDSAVAEVDALKQELSELRADKEASKDFSTYTFEDGEPIDTDNNSDNE